MIHTTKSLARTAWCARPLRAVALLSLGYLAFAVSAAGQASAQFQLPKVRKQDDKAPAGPTGPAEQSFPFGATWILVDVDGKPAVGDTPSFSLDDKLRATGFGGCNSFSMALYPIKGQKLAAGSIATTKKSCGKPVDDAERNMLIGLHSLPVWRLEPNGDLTLKGQTGTMHYRRGL